MSDPLDLRTPLSDARHLRAGDIVYITGRIFTARDEAHRVLLRDGMPEAMAPYSSVLYHCGPVVRDRGGSWEVISAGPTTSARMEDVEVEFIGRFGVKAIIGKGGMGPGTLEALRENGAVYLAYAGGAGALAAARLEVDDVLYLDELGMPEAVWLLSARRFGPLVVAMDSHGRSLYSEVEEKARLKAREI